MTQAVIYAMVAVIVFCVSLYGFIAYAHLIRKIMALNIMASAVFLFFGAMARRGHPTASGEITDPVPQAMVITGIVVAVAATAFAISLARRIAQTTGRMQLPEEAYAGSGSSLDVSGLQGKHEEASGSGGGGG